jgi:hypothetical protein
MARVGEVGGERRLGELSSFTLHSVGGRLACKTRYMSIEETEDKVQESEVRRSEPRMSAQGVCAFEKGALATNKGCYVCYVSGLGQYSNIDAHVVGIKA